MALGYPNPSYLKQAQLKQQSLYNGNVLLKEHDLPVVHDSDETLELAQGSREKMRLLKKEIKPANYAKINHLSGEADESLDKQKSLELEIERLLKASVSHDIMSIVQNRFVDVPSDLRTELDRTKEKLEVCIIKKEKEYAVLWNKWYTICEECKYDKISYDKAYNDMQQKVERLQAQLRDLKGKSSDAPSASNTLDLLNQKLESKIVKLEFQVVNYEREISHLKTTYKNMFDSIKSNRTHAKLHDLIFENAKLRAWLFKNTSESVKTTSGTSATPHVDKPKLSAVTPHSKKLHASTQSHYVPQPREFNVMKHRNVISPEMFKINPSQTPRVDLVPNKQSSASIRTNPITNSQRHVTITKNVSSNMVTASSTGLVHTARTRRPQPKGNTRNARVPSASKSSEVKKIATVEDHRRTLLLSKNRKTMSSECNNIKLAIRNDKYEIICDTCKQCLVTANHDACLTPSVNVLNSRANKLCANVPRSANQKKHRTHVWKPKQVGSKESLAPKPRLPKFSLKWSPSGRSFDLKGKLVAAKETNCPNDDKACTSNPKEPRRKRFPNSTVFLGRVYFVKGLGHNLFLVGQFCDADLEVAFRRSTCFIRNLDGVDLLKGNRSINLYTINLHEMASASPICLMARATHTNSWLWHQRLSHLNFDTINDLDKNDLVSGLPKFKYAKEHLCPSCEKGKSKRASHPPKPVLNSKQRLHLLHMHLCGPMRVASINRKRYVLVIVDDYSRYTWVYFLRTKDETPEVIKNFLKKIYVRLQAPVIIVRTDNETKFKNQVLKGYFDSVGITHETSAAKTPQQNGVVERKNCTLVEAARTILNFSHALLFLWAEAIATACYTQNRSIIHRHFNKTPYELIQDIGKLGAKGDIGFFIGYSANSVAYRVYNRRTRKIMETMNVTFDELSAMAFEQNSSRPRLQSMTSGQISSELELTYAPSTITPHRPSERNLDILFEPLHNEYLGDSAPVPTNSSNTTVSSHNVDATSQQHAQQQRNVTPSPTASAADNVPNAVFDGDLFVNPFGTPSTESVVSSTYIIEPKTVKEALTDPAWIESMQEELHQFIRLDVWELVPSPDDIKPLTLKWLFKNKHDEENMVIRNKTRPVEDVYVCQPEGFIDADYPSHFYKLKKALYGLKQAPRAWYDELSTFLLLNGFSKGTIDPTLSTRRFDDDILVVQVYVDDIIFGSTNPRYATLFSDLMKSRFEMSMMGEMTFFLGLQIGTLVDATKYHSMIGALMYLTSSRPDIVHATCVCARYQAHPTEKHLKEVKRIFRYLRGTVNMGLWYTKDSGFELTGFSDADYAGCKNTFKSTSGGAQFLGEKLMSYHSHILQPGSTLQNETYSGPIPFHQGAVEKGTIELYFVKTDYQLADIFTKALPVDRFIYLVRRLVTMEILLEPTSNKLLVGDVGDSIWIELVILDINLGPE
nr:retrovirus-related Pol polyprotein from transposon TNT 1-94 [Tanacetum cinerariifolium]